MEKYNLGQVYYEILLSLRKEILSESWLRQLPNRPVLDSHNMYEKAGMVTVTETE